MSHISKKLFFCILFLTRVFSFQSKKAHWQFCSQSVNLSLWKKNDSVPDFLVRLFDRGREDRIFPPSCPIMRRCPAQPLCTYKRASAAFPGRDYSDYYRTGVHFFRAYIHIYIYILYIHRRKRRKRRQTTMRLLRWVTTALARLSTARLRSSVRVTQLLGVTRVCFHSR